jgi:CubicO group peptidase (beta-lactamase class C family)
MTLEAPPAESHTRIPPRSRHGRALRWLGLGAAAILALAAILVVTAPLFTEDWYWARILSWRDASVDDFATKFPARTVPNAPPISPLVATPAEVPSALSTVSYPAEAGVTTVPLDSFMSESHTRALLVLRDDTLLVERYANGSSHEAIQTSFSMAKSVDSTMIGIAIAEGAIASIDDPIVQYLPELSGRGLDNVTIRHLLGMDSGLRYDGSGSGGMPWQDDARTYYDPNLRALALTVGPAVEPGTRWEYNNYHPLLIGLILERATGRHVADYLSEKIWQPLGMEGPATWSLDSRHDGFEKMESGINARAVDFARFGRLWLNGGTWYGRQIVPHDWVSVPTRPNAPALKPDYGLFWWLDTARPGRFFAAGNFGQFVYIAPDHNAVVVRSGESYGALSSQQWLAVLRGLADSVPPAA